MDIERILDVTPHVYRTRQAILRQNQQEKGTLTDDAVVLEEESRERKEQRAKYEQGLPQQPEQKAQPTLAPESASSSEHAVDLVA